MSTHKIFVGLLKRLFSSNHYWDENGYGKHDGDFSALVHSPRQRRKYAGEDND
jgi:hypothetical protein